MYIYYRQELICHGDVPPGFVVARWGSHMISETQWGGGIYRIEAIPEHETPAVSVYRGRFAKFFYQVQGPFAVIV